MWIRYNLKAFYKITFLKEPTQNSKIEFLQKKSSFKIFESKKNLKIEEKLNEKYNQYPYIYIVILKIKFQKSSQKKFTPSDYL